MRSESRSLPRRSLLKAAASAAAAIGGLSAWPARANDLKLGRPAPPLVLHALDGSTIRTQDLLGKVVLATFWATWCAPCKEELPQVSDYAREHSAQGLQVLGFSLDGAEALPKVRAIAATLSFPVGLVESPWAGGYGRIWKLPVSFVIDRQGMLAHNGWDDEDPVWTRERLQAVVGPLLRQ